MDGRPSSEPPPAAASRRPGLARLLIRPGLDPLWLGMALLAVYFSNGDCLASGDTLPATCLPVSLLREGNLSIAPEEAPFMFRWTLSTGEESRGVTVRHWDQRIDGRRAVELRAEGRLKLDLPRYYLAESAREGEYLGIYGPGPALAALPVYLPSLWAVEDLPRDLPIVLWMGRIAASLLAAASAVLLMLAASPRLGRAGAWGIALAYGLGTCVWSQSSQALWQQTPVVFLFALAGWAILREPWTAGLAFLSGIALGLAVLCRTTSAILLVAIAWLWVRRGTRLCAHFGLGLLPAALIFALYSARYLESPFDFAHTDSHAGFALAKTGSMDLWQTPIWKGAAGILFSPARGLIVYSPFILFSIWGAVAAWKDPAFRALRPVSLALLGTLALYSRWFDWWGGHSFGYRLIVETTPLFALLLLPVAPRILSCPGLRWTFLALAVWSVGVQGLGAFAYDQGGWNSRSAGFEVRVRGEPALVVVPTRAEADRLAADRGGKVLGEHELDIDRAEHRHRLWSVVDNPIAYYAAQFGPSRAAKRARLRAFLEIR